MARGLAEARATVAAAPLSRRGIGPPRHPALSLVAGALGPPRRLLLHTSTVKTSSIKPAPPHLRTSAAKGARLEAPGPEAPCSAAPRDPLAGGRSDGHEPARADGPDSRSPPPRLVQPPPGLSARRDPSRRRRGHGGDRPLRISLLHGPGYGTANDSE